MTNANLSYDKSVFLHIFAYVIDDISAVFCIFQSDPFLLARFWPNFWSVSVPGFQPYNNRFM